MDFPGSREVKVFVVILIAIIITVPTAYYFLQRPYNPPITVQNGFAEYNWTLEHLYNQTNQGQGVCNINVSANATIQQEGYDQSSFDMMLVNDSIIAAMNPLYPGYAFEFFLSARVSGRLSSDLYPKSILPNVTYLLPPVSDIWESYNGASAGDNTTVSNAGYGSPYLTSYMVITFENHSRNLTGEYNFGAWAWWYIDFKNLSIGNVGAVFSMELSLAMTGLQHTVYDNVTFNLNAENLR